MLSIDGNRDKCTLVSRPATSGRYPQTSSAVKLSTGATSRTKASAIRHSAVCAERRYTLDGASVYIRSFSASRYKALRSTMQNSFTA